MSAPLGLLPFQRRVADGVLARLDAARRQYAELPASAEPMLAATIARRAGAVMLCAPTGVGKTLLAADVLDRFSADQRVLWFWFTPFAGLVDQARAVLRAQAPALRLLDLEVDRRFDALRDGGLFVATWQSVARANQAGLRARTRDDAGASLDDLLAQARADGLRIGCVIDEAHHGFHKAKEARAFFTDVLCPDYTLMLTATPRDADARRFEDDTGYRIGDPDDWATVSRIDGVEAGLLKRGVKLVRFIAPDNQLATLVDFERNALTHCAAMHRRIRQLLAEAGIALVPLMLVQVPNGGAELKEARRILVEDLGFADAAVRAHTAKEPDADLAALAHDPTVEVLLFKMAVATGFDAPRAFTLAALRGIRDKDFGIQVVGRLMRVHPLLRQRELPGLLAFAHVFLANSESQEGLLAAGAEIERLQTEVPELGAQTVVSVVGATHTVQVLRSGQSGSLLVDAQGVHACDDREPQSATSMFDAIGADLARAGLLDDLFAGTPAATSQASRALVDMLGRDASVRHRYALRKHVPVTLQSEFLPDADAATEQHVADLVDFSASTLGAMHQALTRLLRRERDMFPGTAEESESYVVAQLDAAQVARKVEQQLGLFDLDPRSLMAALAARFPARLIEAGIAVPDDSEALDRALDLVLVRHPELLRNAFKAVRMNGLHNRRIDLPREITSDEARPPSRHNAYGVMPAGFDSEDEREFARVLDRCEDVLWWHRNPSQRPESLKLYRWDDGAAFHPDFVVAFRGRDTADHIALVEVKGPRGWRDPVELAKALGPAHDAYGRCLFVGREKGGRFQLLKAHGDELVRFSEFDPAQLRFVER